MNTNTEFDLIEQQAEKLVDDSSAVELSLIDLDMVAGGGAIVSFM